jgi:hypothetical protein
MKLYGGGERVRASSGKIVAVVVCLICIFLPVVTLASQQSDSSRGPGAGFPLLPLLIAYWTRKRPIGGWLLVYYGSLYADLCVSLIACIVSFSNLSLSLWQNTQYVLLIVNIAVSTVATIVTAVVSTLLLRQRYRNLKMVSLLKKLLLFCLVWSIVSLGLDSLHPGDDMIILDVMSLAASIVWYLYILRSKRVQHVFVLGDFRVWYAASHPSKRIINNRTADWRDGRVH